MQSVLLLSMTSLHNTCRTGWICRAHPSRQFPPANLRHGYNVITIPLSLKARLCLQKGKAKENLCKEPTMSYLQCMFHTVVVILFSFALSGGHRAACTHMYDGASEDAGFVTRPQQPPPLSCSFAMCCFTGSPSRVVKPSSRAVHAQLQEPCPGAISPAGLPWGWQMDPALAWTM